MGKLRSVTPGESPRQPMSVSQAAGEGSRRDLLVALRDRIAKSVASPSTLPRDLAALSKRLMDIVDEFEALMLRVVAMLSVMLQQPLTRSGLFPETAGLAPTPRRNDPGFLNRVRRPTPALLVRASTCPRTARNRGSRGHRIVKEHKDPTRRIDLAVAAVMAHAAASTAEPGPQLWVFNDSGA